MFTLDQLNAHADKLETEGMGGELHLTAKGVKASPEEIITKVCGFYQKVRPFLEAIGNLFFVPKKWRTAILSFVAIMDGLCPQTTIPDL